MRNSLMLMCKRIAALLMGLATLAQASEVPRNHGHVGLRLLPHDAKQAESNSLWAGVGDYASLEGQYPFVAENLDLVWGPRGAFKTDKAFFEWYIENDGGDAVDPNPKTSRLVEYIRKTEQSGMVAALQNAVVTNDVNTAPQSVEFILICRETKLSKRGKPGPFPTEDYRILFTEDVAALRKLFRDAHAAGLLKHDHYKLIQLVDHPSFFATNPEAQKIILSMDGVVHEAHHFNRHWPLDTGWTRPELVVRGAQWILEQGKDYIFYYGPFLYEQSKEYHPFLEREWLQSFWQAGLPKRHPKMHYFINAFPYRVFKRPVGPESDPHSNLGFTKWLIEEIRGD